MFTISRTDAPCRPHSVYKYWYQYFKLGSNIFPVILWIRMDKVFTISLNLLLWTYTNPQTFRLQETIKTKLGMWHTRQPPIYSGLFLEQLWELHEHCRKGSWYSFLYSDSHTATLLTLWPNSWTLKFLHTIYATCEYFMRDIGIKLFALAALKEHQLQISFVIVLFVYTVHCQCKCITECV